MGEGDEGDVAVPAGVGASFEVVQAEAVFEFAVVVFDAPADLGQLHECCEWRVGGQGPAAWRLSDVIACSGVSGAPDTIRTCDLHLRRVVSIGFQI